MRKACFCECAAFLHRVFALFTSLYFSRLKSFRPQSTRYIFFCQYFPSMIFHIAAIAISAAELSLIAAYARQIRPPHDRLFIACQIAAMPCKFIDIHQPSRRRRLTPCRADTALFFS